MCLLLVASLGAATAASSLAQHAALFRPGVMMPGSPFLSPLFPWPQTHPLHAAMLQQTLAGSAASEHMNAVLAGNDSSDSSRVGRSLSLSLVVFILSISTSF